MKLIGLTGGIASGKTTVAQLLIQKGFPVLFADQIARDIVQPGQPALQEIANTFGPSVIQPDGTLHRSKLGSLVFADSTLRAQLNAITHPRVAQAAALQIQEHQRKGHSILFYEVPLLFENNMQDLFHAVILVSAPPSLQLQRMIERDKLSHEEAQRRIDSQMSLQDKTKHATYVLPNTGDLKQLKQDLHVIIRMITNA